MSRISDPLHVTQWRDKLTEHKLTEQSVPASAAFVAVDVDPSPNQAGNCPIQIELPGGAVVRLDCATSPEVLRKSVAAIVDATSSEVRS